jgi:hypothetical protein
MLFFAFLFSPMAVDSLIQSGKSSNAILWSSIDPGIIICLPALLAAASGVVFQWWQSSRRATTPNPERTHAG